MSLKKLIVNADDFGLSELTNQGIIQSIHSGIVTSVSLMANESAFDSAILFLKTAPDISTGWHINLTTGYPVLNKNKIPTLVNKNGQFWGKYLLFKKWLCGKIDKQELLMELHAQLKKIEKTGITLDFIDSHHDIHCWPFLAPVLSPLLATKNLTKIRYIGSKICFSQNRLNLFTSLVSPGLQYLVNKPGYSRQSYSSDFIWGSALLKRKDKLNTLKRLIAGCQTGVNEIICHPGITDMSLAPTYYYIKERQMEMDALCDPVLNNILTDNNIQLISSKDF